MLADPRSLLRSLYDEAVRAADPMICVPRALPQTRPERLLVIGAGKASARMAEALESVWGPCEGLVITRYGYERPLDGITLCSASHPVPDQAGVEATRRLRTLVERADAATTIIALISGGGSALLVEPAGAMTLADKMAVNAALLASGAPIDQINVVRKHLSRIKGGQLAAAAHPARLHALMISDVPGDDPAFIASGPTVGDASTPADALAIVARWHIDLPPAARAVLEAPTAVVPVDDPRLATTTNTIIAAPSQSLDAAAALGRLQGLEAKILGDALEGEARELAAAHAALARQVREGASMPTLLLSGGECTVTRRGDGAGGPNAEYALALALALDGTPGIHALACDTDGVDGAPDRAGHEVAGALVAPDTLARARAAGLDPAAMLDANDAHSVFGALGDQVTPGPTLTNVNDFRAILIDPR